MEYQVWRVDVPRKTSEYQKAEKRGSIGMSVKVQWPMFSKKKPAWLQLPRTRNPFSLLHYSWFQVQEVGRRINPKIPIARFPQRYANSIGKLNERNSVPRDSAKRKSEEETSQEQEKPRKEEEASEQQERGKLFRIKSKFTKKRGNEVKTSDISLRITAIHDMNLTTPYYI